MLMCANPHNCDSGSQDQEESFSFAALAFAGSEMTAFTFCTYTCTYEVIADTYAVQPLSTLVQEVLFCGVVSMAV